MLSAVVRGLCESAERSVLGDTSTFQIVTVMVHYVPTLVIFKYLSRASVLVQYAQRCVQFPKIKEDAFEELIIYDGKAEVL